MKKIYLLPYLFLLAAAALRAQSADDVLRYSFLQPGGSARFVGAGGAFGALGAEFSALSQNPAGIAMFRSNELVITPSLRFSKVDATLEGNLPLDDRKSSFAFDNFGLIFNSTPRESKWKAVNFGIGLNRQNNYNSSIFYEGDANGTIVNYFFKYAQPVIDKGGTVDDLYPYAEQLAYNAGALFIDSNTDSLTSDFAGQENARLHRSQAINTFGKMNEMVISFGGNFDEKLMLGATIGVPFVNYRIEGEYTEQDQEDRVPIFNQLKYTEYLRTEGVGVNLKLGVIYKINQAFRVGAAFHTPTLLSLTDTYNNTFTYEYTIAGENYGGDPVAPEYDGVSDYKLRTPWRASASAAAVIKKVGFLSADIEVVDYTNNRFNFTADVPSQENEALERSENTQIQKQYQQAINMRFGAEVALDNFRLRGGLNLLGKPQDGESGFNTAFTAGAGVRNKSFYLDVAWRRYVGDGFVRAYDSAPVVTTENAVSDILLTVGFKF